MLTRALKPALYIAFVYVWCATLGAAPPSRIVSTSPSITETLFALGLGDRVVGVSTFCRFPPAVEALPKIGTFLRPDAELIARLRPDLVVIHPGPSGIEQRLSALRIPFVTVDRGRLSGVYSSIRTIAAAAGVPDSATTVVSSACARPSPTACRSGCCSSSDAGRERSPT